MAERDEGKGFKVEDRRRFSAEGELKPEHRGDTPEPAATQATSAPPSPPPREQPPPSSGAQTGAAPAGDIEINFATFVVSLSTQALAALGEMPDPMTGQRERDLHAAQQLIDIIGMLRDKTRGNLDRNEEALVEGILFDLRMKYVELARAAGH